MEWWCLGDDVWVVGECECVSSSATMNCSLSAIYGEGTVSRIVVRMERTTHNQSNQSIIVSLVAISSLLHNLEQMGYEADIEGSYMQMHHVRLDECEA